METANSSQTRLVYNPQLQSAEMTEKLFVVRQQQFTLLLNDILKEKEKSIPQHYLIVGQRGMGKTTILKRMEVELHKEQYRQQFIPLLYREEQYNIKDLSEFWLNTLDALADSLQLENYPVEMLADIDKTIQELLRKAPEIVSKEAYEFLMNICRKLHRRPVLLIDNIDIVFSGLGSSGKNKQEQWALRKLLSENGAPIIIGGGVTTTDDVAKYDMPFYNYFKIQYLKKLNYEEFVKLLNNLAAVTNSDATVFTTIRQNTSRQKALLELTGGSPRLTVMLFDQISKGFSTDINDDLNILVDAITPLYKAKFEELSQQQRTIIDAIALHWDAISLRKLAMATRMKNNQLSPQLKRLLDDGWLETTPAYRDKGNAYFISERFFNIYYLIRNSSRRHKDKIYCLSKFLECFYGKEELEKISNTLLKQDICNSEQMRLYLALSEIKALKQSKRKKVQEKTFETLLNNDELRKEFDVSEKSLLQNFQAFNVAKITDLTTKIKPEDAEFWKDIGSFLQQKNQYEKAIVCFNKSVTIDPKNTFNRVFKGICLFFMQRYEEAIICYDKAIQINPEDEYVWEWKGNALVEMQRYEEAIICYDKAIQINSKDEYAWKWKGNALVEMQRYEEAIICYDKAIQINPEDENVWEWKGNALVEMQRSEEAIICYDKAIQINSKDEYAWKWKGRALVGMQRYEEAIICYDKAIQLNPEDEYAWGAKGFALVEMQRYEEAIICYDKAIQLNPEDEYAWGAKGNALVGMQRYEEAAVAYEKSREINPQEIGTKFQLMFLYRDKLNEKNKAIEIFASIKEEDINQNKEKRFVCHFYLDKTLFALYEQNNGIAKENLLRAFDAIEDEQKLGLIINEAWWSKFGSVVITLGYGSWLLELLKEKGYDVVLSPYYTAIKALEIEKQHNKKGKEDAEIYLNNRAIEISEPAREIVEKIRKYMD